MEDEEKLKIINKTDLDVKERFKLITRNTEEILTPEDLRVLLENGTKLQHYIGFEVSGKIHLGGLLCMSKVKDLMDAGVDCSIFLADIHSWINNKLGGDIKRIQKVAAGYFKEGLKTCLKVWDGDPSKLKFVLGSDFYHNNDKYWETVLEISKNTTLSRIKRSITIAGRKEGEAVNFATLIYPPMQVADIFTQGINLAHAGMDQRKAHVIARDVALKLKISPLIDNKGKQIKPIAIHTPLLLGLGKPPIWPIPKDKLQELWSSLKMSKSKPDTCIFIHDSPEEIRRKINKAFCPEGETEFNPLLNWAKYLIFKDENSQLEIKRPEKFGGDKIYKSYQELEADFAQKKLHPIDLKNAMAEKIITLLEPVRKHFEKPEVKALLNELEKMIITR